MSLDRTSAVLELIEAQSTNSPLDSAISSFLAQYLAVILYSEMEEKISEAIRKTLIDYTSVEIAVFIHNHIEKIVSRTPKSDINKLVSKFGEKCKKAFNERVREDIVTEYSNIIQARHQVGHGKGAVISLSEVKRGLMAANIILAALHECLTEIG